jgi:hypothetical protein
MSDDNVKWIDIGEKMVKQMLEKLYSINIRSN